MAGAFYNEAFNNQAFYTLEPLDVVVDAGTANAVSSINIQLLAELEVEASTQAAVSSLYVTSKSDVQLQAITQDATAYIAVELKSEVQVTSTTEDVIAYLSTNLVASAYISATTDAAFGSISIEITEWIAPANLFIVGKNLTNIVIPQDNKIASVDKLENYFCA